MVFLLQILCTPHCFLHASSSLTHCVYIITHLVCAVSLTNNLFTSYHSAPPLTPHVFYSCSPYLSVQDGDSALQIAVRRGHLDVVKVLVQVYRDCHMESEVGQYYMDLAYDYGHGHVVGYLSSEFSSLKQKVSVVSQPVSKVGTQRAITHCTNVLLPRCLGTPSAVVSQPVKELTHTASVGVFIQWCMCSSMPASASATASTH